MNQYYDDYVRNLIDVIIPANIQKCRKSSVKTFYLFIDNCIVTNEDELKFLIEKINENFKGVVDGYNYKARNEDEFEPYTKLNLVLNNDAIKLTINTLVAALNEASNYYGLKFSDTFNIPVVLRECILGTQHTSYIKCAALVNYPRIERFQIYLFKSFTEFKEFRDSLMNTNHRCMLIYNAEGKKEDG